MTPRHEVGNRDGIEYRLIQNYRGVWLAALDCDCILGPHWHELGKFHTKRAAYDRIDGNPLGTVHA